MNLQSFPNPSLSKTQEKLADYSERRRRAVLSGLVDIEAIPDYAYAAIQPVSSKDECLRLTDLLRSEILDIELQIQNYELGAYKKDDEDWLSSATGSIRIKRFQSAIYKATLRQKWLCDCDGRSLLATDESTSHALNALEARYNLEAKQLEARQAETELKILEARKKVLAETIKLEGTKSNQLSREILLAREERLKLDAIAGDSTKTRKLIREVAFLRASLVEILDSFICSESSPLTEYSLEKLEELKKRLSGEDNQHD